MYKVSDVGSFNKLEHLSGPASNGWLWVWDFSSWLDFCQAWMYESFIRLFDGLECPWGPASNGQLWVCSFFLVHSWWFSKCGHTYRGFQIHCVGLGSQGSQYPSKVGGRCLEQK